jgi:hypothetical protein
MSWSEEEPQSSGQPGCFGQQLGQAWQAAHGDFRTPAAIHSCAIEKSAHLSTQRVRLLPEARNMKLERLRRESLKLHVDGGRRQARFLDASAHLRIGSASGLIPNARVAQ